MKPRGSTRNAERDLQLGELGKKSRKTPQLGRCQRLCSGVSRASDVSLFLIIAFRQVISLASLGLDASMWGELVWHFARYFGRGSCAGPPAAMASDARREKWSTEGANRAFEAAIF